jgi:probable F420-dependent oxidoreductase
LTSTPTPLSLAIQGGTVDLFVTAAQAAERAGFRSIWTTELHNRSAVVSLAAAAGATERIELGSGVAWGFGRSPLTLATDARSLDEISGGRLTLGVGTGSPQSMADWHGVREPHPATRIKEFILLLKKIWQLSDTAVEHDGRFYRCQLPADPGLPALSRGTIPTCLAGVQPPMLRAAGAVADGLVGHPMFSPRYVEEVVRPELAKGAAQTGRDTPVPINGMIICAVADDAGAARRAAATQIAAYATRVATDALLEFHGFMGEVAAIREAFGRRDFPAMVGAVTENMLDQYALYGTPDEVVDKYRDRYESLYEQPLLYSPNTGLPPEYVHENVHAICDTFAYAKTVH